MPDKTDYTKLTLCTQEVTNQHTHESLDSCL